MDRRTDETGRRRETDNNRTTFDIRRIIAARIQDERILPPAEQTLVADDTVQIIPRQSHEMMRNRIQRLMGVDDDGQRQYLWRLMKEEVGGVATYETSAIREWRTQQRAIIDDQEMQMWKEIGTGNRTENDMKTEMDTIMKEYNLQEMQLLLDEVGQRIEQSQSPQRERQTGQRRSRDINERQIIENMLNIEEDQLEETLQNMNINQITSIRVYIDNLIISSVGNQNRRNSLIRLSDALLEHRLRREN